jgi:UDP-glucuronate 4-epimerase
VKILVTGAAGFIGSHLFKSLKEAGLDVLGIDNYSSYYSAEYKKTRLKKLGISQTSAEVMECDISIYEELDFIMSKFKPEYVINLAAQAGVRLSLEESSAYALSNIIGFQNIVRASVKNKVKGILYASSSSVYGDSAPIPYKETYSSLKPNSIYGVTKLSNEMFAEIYSKTSELRFRGLRFFTVYGPWGRPDMAYFRIAAAALGQGQFQLFGDGSIKRDFTFIDDVTKCTIALLNDLTKRASGFNDVVNIGGNRPFDMNFLIDLISKNGEFPILIQRSQESKLDLAITSADNSYLKSILGEIEFTGLKAGIVSLMNWARQAEIKGMLKNWTNSVH